MLLNVALLIVGFAILIKGADFFIDGASALGVKLGIPQIIIGLNVIAFGTSLPELFVNINSSIQQNNDLVLGNILGSNIFNILILALDDIFYTKGLLLKDSSEFHIISVLSTIIMTAVVVVGLSYRAIGKRFFLAWDAALIFLIYIINLFFIYHFTS